MLRNVLGQRLIVDADLAALYDADAKRFNEVVKRNLARFLADCWHSIAKAGPER